MYDIIIIGGGMAGLYCAYQVLRKNPETKILILEAESHLGGRAGGVPFHGVNILSGAGVGRKEKDKRLITLLRDLGLSPPEFPVKAHYSDTIHPICKLKKDILELRKRYVSKIHRSMTFKEFATRILGSEEYKNFVICSGYTDYENEDAYGTLYHYGFEDNYADWTAIGVSWTELIQKLVDKIGKKNILLSHRVSKIADSHRVVCENGKSFESDVLVLATTVDSVLRLLPGANLKQSLYRQIHGQPFLRVYGQFSKESIPIMKRVCPFTTVVPGPLHKIIPMNPDKGVYMIAYTDNKDSKTVDKYSENTAKNRDVLCRLLEIAFGIEPESLSLLDMKDFFWPIGTHYYEPLKGNDQDRIEFIKKAQRPMDNVFVVGEMISLNQGWVEGALESVENILPDIL
jgi:hypothetical protein